MTPTPDNTKAKMKKYSKWTMIWAIICNKYISVTYTTATGKIRAIEFEDNF